jgi:hypothetical protein
MSYENEVKNKQFQLNLVIDIGGELFSSYQVDSDIGDLLGTTSGIPTERIGLIDKVRTSGNKTDIRNVRTSLANLSFSLLDKEERVTAIITADEENLLEKEVKFYVGFITGSFDFADYQLISKTYVKQVTKSRNFYQFSTRETTSLLRKGIFQIRNQLSVDISDVATSLQLEDATDFPTSGRVKVNDEVMQYSGKSSNTLLNLSRGDLNSTADVHKAGDDCNYMTETGDDNPIDIILKIITSGVGDTSNGPYDVYTTGGMGIDQALVDVARFEEIRGDFFVDDEFRDYLYAIDDGLRYLEEEYLKANNLRFITKNGKISLAILDQVDLTADVPEMNEDSQEEGANWQAKSDKIVNYIIVKYDYNEGLGRYTRTQEFIDTESVEKFTLKPLELKFRAMRADLSGSAIATNRATRLLGRLSTPRAAVKVKTHFDQSTLNIGDKVQFINRFLPQQGGGLGMNEQLEVLSRAINWSTGQVSFDLEFTSYAGLRIGLIAPSPVIDTVNSQTEFVLPLDTGSCYRVGDVIWIDGNAGDYKTITAISGDTITIGSPFTITVTNTDVIKIAPYDIASQFQRSRYAFIVGPTGFFDDNTKGYQILF